MVRKKFGNTGSFHNVSFSERVLAMALMIPPGRVVTYGDLAKAAGGGAMAAQSITSILSKAFDRGVKNIPFHRIVYAGGRVWLSEGHEEPRLRLYKKEGIELDERLRIKNLVNVLYDLDDAKKKISVKKQTKR